MISKESYAFNTYAINRISEIQQETEASEWYWAPGNLTVTDWLTRGKSPEDLGSNGIWQSGPTFLSLPVEDWPVCRETQVTDLPERHSKVVLATET